MVNCCLPPNRRIDHGHNGGRYLEEGDATLVTSSSKTSHITNYTATQSNKGSLPVKTRRERLVKNLHQLIHRLVLFTVTQHHCLYPQRASCTQSLNRALQVQWRYRLVCHHQHTVTRHVLREQWAIQKPTPYVYRIRPLFKVYRNSLLRGGCDGRHCMQRCACWHGTARPQPLPATCCPPWRAARGCHSAEGVLERGGQRGAHCAAAQPRGS
mmetsp:Transcript_20121/g.68426  ORF Transcript_20121/g.68426 Transcript_20121/m.68426 type:complete len:212 (-) Transcript_20121:39-674(-)